MAEEQSTQRLPPKIGEVAIPVASIQKIHLGGFESDVFESKYDGWALRSAKEFKKNNLRII